MTAMSVLLKDYKRKEGVTRKRGQVPDIPQSVEGCGCWCTGWCKVMVRMLSGVTSWVARVLIRPDLTRGKTSVQRSISS